MADNEILQMHDLQPAPGAKKDRTRVGRGEGSKGKTSGRGAKGHIGFAVNDIDAAEKWFAERGLEVNEESRVLLPDGGTKLVYFKREFAGFAVHLCRE